MTQRNNELLELIERSITDQLDADGCERLRELLTLPANQSIYCDYLGMHAELHWNGRYHGLPATQLLNVASNCIDCQTEQNLLSHDDSQEVQALADSSSLVRPTATWESGGGFGWRSWASLAAALTACLVLAGLWSWDVQLGRYLLGLDSADSGGDIVLARITGTRNSRWENDNDIHEFGYDSPLYAGQTLKLTQGLAEVTFTSGVRVIMEAPATLDVAAYNESSLRSGRMTALVPDGAEGFRVTLEAMTIVDRGTEFGLHAKDDGQVEVHVFDGLVEGHFDEGWGPLQGMVQWRQDSAVSINPAQHSISPIEDAGSKFVRSLASSGPANGLLAKEDFEYPPAPLALQNGGFGWGGPWTILTSQGDAAISNAIQEGSLRHLGLMHSGNRVALLGNFNRVRRTLSTSIGGVFDSAGYVEDQDGARLIGRDGTTVYLSYTQRISATTEEFYGLELNRGDGNRNRVLCFGHGAHRVWIDGPPGTPHREMGATGWAVTSEFNGPDKNRLLDLGSLGQETTEAVLVVDKVAFGEGNRDTQSVYVNPESLMDEQRCQATVEGTGNFAFDQVSLANFGGFKTFEVDHLRVGRSFTSVTTQSFDATQLMATL
ncbi:MAG TPA: hypothetical protein DCF63_19000 [Planctomycetaceae bacterium]|nr:hypothetical protein [Planctomycetaceae bacterium]